MALMNVLIDAGKETRGFTLTKRAVQAANREEFGTVYTFTDNAGTHRLSKARVIAERPKGNAAVVQFCKDRNIGYVMVGPEQQLVDGVADALRQAGILVFGPGAKAAQLEGSKLYGREFCREFGVPIPEFTAYSDLNSLREALSQRSSATTAVKADWLMAGKGVGIYHELPAATLWAEKLFAEDKATQVLLESYIKGHPDLARSELSLHVPISLDGSYRILPPIMDYKPRFPGDLGPMTGSMGCGGPVPWAEMQVIEETVVKPIMKGLKKHGLKYGGVLYISLKKGADGRYYVIEFNVRFGDPEMTVLDRLVKKGLMPLMLAAAKGEDVSKIPLEFHDGAAVGVVIADHRYALGKTQPCVVPPQWDIDDLYHAATYLENGVLMANGGRNGVMVDEGIDLANASENAYAKLGPWLDFRTDICID